MLSALPIGVATRSNTRRTDPARGLTSPSCPVSRKTPIIGLAGSDLAAAGNEGMAHHSLQPAAIARAANTKLQVRGASPTVRGVGQ
jgi:hypothetical protein